MFEFGSGGSGANRNKCSITSSERFCKLNVNEKLLFAEPQATLNCVDWKHSQSGICTQCSIAQHSSTLASARTMPKQYSLSGSTSQIVVVIVMLAFGPSGGLSTM